MRGLRLVQFSLAATLVMSLGACSQSRAGISNLGATQELWQTMDLCTNLKGAKYQGCFQLTPNITSNVMYMQVGSLPWNTTDPIPYRVLARAHGVSFFDVLLDNVNSAVGSTLQINPAGSRSITDYEEWRVETTEVLSPMNGIDLIAASAGQGDPLAQAVIIWPELAQQTGVLPNNNSNNSNFVTQ